MQLLQELNHTFEKHTRIYRSAETVILYGYVMKAWLDWFAKKGITSLEQITVPIVEDWMLEHKESISSSTMKVRMSVLGMFLKDAKSNLILPRAPKVVGKRIKYLTENEIGTIFKVLKGRRQKLIVTLLYTCGLRVSELCGIKRSDIDFDLGCIQVIGKGGKFRVVTMLGNVKDQLRDYIETRPDFWSYVFASPNGTGQKPVGRKSMWDLISRIGKKAGINKPVSPHMFRHSFATHLVESEVPIKAIQMALGHTNIETTEKYTHVSPNPMMRAIRSHVPESMEAVTK